jgi:IclR family transcriptional regulator, mhp operon transcriptional activator
MLETSTDPEDHPPDLPGVVRQLVRTIRARGFAERDPATEPVTSSTVAIPKLIEQIVRPLQETGARIDPSIAAMKTH